MRFSLEYKHLKGVFVMATFLFPKLGTKLTHKRGFGGATDFIYQGSVYSTRGNNFMLTSLTEPKVTNWNYYTFKQSDFEAIDEKHLEVFKDAQGNPFEDDIYYTNSTNGSEYRILGIVQWYTGDILTTDVAAIKRGSRAVKNHETLELQVLSKSAPKTKLSKAQREALGQRSVALEYIFKICLGLNYDSSRMTEDNVDSLVATFNTKSKAELNKAIMDLFDNMTLPVVNFDDTIKNVLKFSTKFQKSDVKLKKYQGNVDAWEAEVKEVDNTVMYFQQNIDEYQKSIEKVKKDQTKWDIDKRKEYNDSLAKAKITLADYLKTVDNGGEDNHTKIILNGLNKIITDIVEQGGGFYKFSKIVLETEIKSHDDLRKLKIIFTTNRVFGRDARVAGLTFDAGEFEVVWYPFYENFQADQIAYSKDLRPGHPDLKINPFKDNTIIDGYPHPHVQKGGYVCWGEIDSGITRQMQFNADYVFTGKPYEVFNKIKVLLHSYNASSPYKRLVEFAVRKNPELLSKIETEFKAYSNAVLYNPDKKTVAGDNWSKFSADYYAKIHEVTISSIRDAKGGTLAPTERTVAAHLTCKTYVKRYVGVDHLVPKGETGKSYIKTSDNQFVLLKNDTAY